MWHGMVRPIGTRWALPSGRTFWGPVPPHPPRLPCQCGGIGALLAGYCRNRRQSGSRFPEIQGFRQSRIAHTAKRRRSGASTFRKQLTATPSPYIAPPPARHDTQQIPVDRSLGLYRRSNNRRILAAVPTLIKHLHPREHSSAQEYSADGRVVNLHSSRNGLSR